MSALLDLLAAAIVALTGTPADHAPRCATDDATGCVWVADHAGDGTGSSYVATPGGHVLHIPDALARRAAPDTRPA